MTPHTCIEVGDTQQIRAANFSEAPDLFEMKARHREVPGPRLRNLNRTGSTTGPADSFLRIWYIVDKQISSLFNGEVG